MNSHALIRSAVIAAQILLAQSLLAGALEPGVDFVGSSRAKMGQTIAFCLCEKPVQTAADSLVLHFYLNFNASNRSAWSQVLRHPSAIPTALQLPDNTTLACPSLNLIAMSSTEWLLSFALLLLFAYISFYLAARTELIRDPVPPPPATLPPSLAADSKTLTTDTRTNLDTASSTSQVTQTTDGVSRAAMAIAHQNRTRGRASALIWGIPLVIVAILIVQLNYFAESDLVGAVFFGAVVVWIFYHHRRFWKSTKAGAAELAPYSLARTQMAVWFFLIVCSWFFLWLLTGTFNTLSNTVLALMGIGAGTALGAEAQDAGKSTPAEDIAGQIKTLQGKVQDKTIVSIEQNQLDALQKRYTAALAKDSQPPKSENFFEDVLTDADGISFHRFQMFVWTIVLAVVFVSDVCQKLIMPDFDNTLLALMGISSGTYLGFMIKEPHSSTQSQ